MSAITLSGPVGSPENELIDRDLSWLRFNLRVLNEALDRRTPLLERVNFLQIFRSNLDEFFMKRVGGLKRQVAAGVSVSSKLSAEASPMSQLAQVRGEILSLIDKQTACIMEEIRPALFQENIHLLRWEDLTPSERECVEKFFREKLFPLLTPLAVDPGHPFPFISNLSTSLGVLLRHPGVAHAQDRSQDAERNQDGELFARVKIPDVFPSWIRVNPESERGARYFSQAEMIARNLNMLFPGMEVVDLMVFRITRNAEIERDEEDVEDLLEMIEEELRERRFARVIRLEHGPNPNPKILALLSDELDLQAADIYEMPLELDYFSLKAVAELTRPELRYTPWSPVVPASLMDESVDIFSLIREQDMLVHHPYESFGASVERFIRTAVEDPNVVGIKMTLYRTGDNSPFVSLLEEAAESGKQVVCLVELKARFDEQKNILAAQKLEKAGAHVVYGIVGLKTHCKVAQVIRREHDTLRCYVHVGTGNYHAGTARLYTDFGYFTANPEVSEDVIHLFHYLTGRSHFHDYKKLVIAPIALRKRFMELIDREVEFARTGCPARIIAKMNSLEEREICQALYRASQAGVKIDLIVRGVCCLRPGVPGLSENIRVTSVIGRFLEHSRIFYFQNGAKNPVEGAFYIGSADWMYRNLAARVEVVVPIEPRALREKLWEVLCIHHDDQRQVWEMSSDGTYVQRIRPEQPNCPGSHQRLMELTLRRESLAGVEARG